MEIKWAEGRVFPDNPEAFVEMEVFDDDGPEGYFKKYFFRSSYLAAKYFVEHYGRDYFCKITQRTP